MRREKLAQDALSLVESHKTADRIYVISYLMYKCFGWGATKQGHSYWSKIRQELKDLSNEHSSSEESDNGPELKSGTIITAASLTTTLEQLLADAEATLKSEQEKQPVNKKIINQWQYAVNCLRGASHKRGLLHDLEDAGPGAY